MTWKEITNRIPNMFVLENEIIAIDDVCFLGTTLWTKLKQFPDEMLSKDWSDFYYIKGMTVSYWNSLHEKAVKFIETAIQQTDKKIVVITHHAPSPSSIAEQFESSQENCFYYTDLDRLMWYNPIKLWIHGHMHTSFDYVIGDEEQSTRVICNPYGYYEEHATNQNFDPNFIVDI
jgi:Icc-related predicted phosphoesterase